MACRGVHFAITDEDLEALRKAPSDESLIGYIQETIEERWERPFVCETDKAWDAIHRCLTDGKLEYENGTYPLKLCILGGEQLHSGEDYIVSLVLHSELEELSNHLNDVTPDFIAGRYWKMPPDYDQPKSNEDCQYTWDWFEKLPEFFKQAHQNGRHVIFTVDQ